MMAETTSNKKLLRMFHGAVFSKRAPLAAGGKRDRFLDFLIGEWYKVTRW
jgi:hypothetical protein